MKTQLVLHPLFPSPPPQVEALLASEDYGKDLASVNNLLKKHQLLEADISAHEVLLSLLVLEDKSVISKFYR